MNISVQRLAEMRQAAEIHTLLDIREAEEVSTCAIGDSLHIPMNDLPGRLESLPKEAPLVVMCHLGGRSAQVTQWLRQNGYDNAVNLDGGIAAWAAEIDPSMARY